MDLDRVIGSRLRELRLHRGLSQGGVAEGLGISTSSLSAYERGTRPIKLSMLGRLADHYGVPIAALVDARERLVR